MSDKVFLAAMLSIFIVSMVGLVTLAWLGPAPAPCQCCCQHQTQCVDVMSTNKNAPRL